MSVYPAHREADVVLSDGSTVSLRPVRPGDEAALRAFFDALDERSQAFRFFSGAVDLERAAREMARVDYEGRYALLATRGSDEVPVGHGIYIDLGQGRAEVAFAVATGMQGRGLGTILLAHLAEAAAENGIETFVAEVLPANHRMIEMFHASGLAVSAHADADLIRAEMPTSLSAEATERFADRDRLAAVAAVRSFLEPRSIAVVGASRRPGQVGSEVLANLLDSGFRGTVHVVNRKARRVQGIPAVSAVARIDGPVDLAVLAIPAGGVLEVARECADAGVRALVVLSAGFAESGPDGSERERQLLAICREAGIRLVGPNCLGILSTDPEHPLNATFAPRQAPPGNVGFVTQSGALGLALTELAAAKGVGVSSFVSVGNRADITANDLLEFWEQDAATAVNLLYIESFSDPRRFARVARRVGRKKPVVVVKSGRSSSGVRAAGSHTGALAAPDRTADALFRQTGVIRTDTLAELLDVAALLSSQPLPRGPRVGILTNAGGPGIMCADACEAAGLEVPELAEEVREELRAFLPGEAGLGNPVDMIATAGARHYRRAIECLGRWDGIDALIVIFIRPLLTEPEDVAGAIQEAVPALPRELPVQAVFISGADQAPLRELARVPTYAYPEDAARALGRVADHVRWRQRPAPSPAEPEPGLVAEGASILAEALGEGQEWLDPQRCARLLRAYGIAMPAREIAADAAAAGRAAAAIDGPVVLKAVGPAIGHKTEIGAVRPGLAGAEQVTRAAETMSEELARQGIGCEGFEVQATVADGVELIVGIATDPVFGQVIACGAGGTAVELGADVELRVAPLDAGDPREMLDRLAMRPLLDGYRGSDPADLPGLEAAIAAVGRIAAAHPEISELDLNPLIATPAGAFAVDCRVRVRPATRRPSWPRTWD